MHAFHSVRSCPVLLCPQSQRQGPRPARLASFSPPGSTSHRLAGRRAAPAGWWRRKRQGPRHAHLASSGPLGSPGARAGAAPRLRVGRAAADVEADAGDVQAQAACGDQQAERVARLRAVLVPLAGATARARRSRLPGGGRRKHRAALNGRCAPRNAQAAGHSGHAQVAGGRGTRAGPEGPKCAMAAAAERAPGASGSSRAGPPGRGHEPPGAPGSSARSGRPRGCAAAPLCAGASAPAWRARPACPRWSGRCRSRPPSAPGGGAATAHWRRFVACCGLSRLGGPRKRARTCTPELLTGSNDARQDCRSASMLRLRHPACAARRGARARRTRLRGRLDGVRVDDALGRHAQREHRGQLSRAGAVEARAQRGQHAQQARLGHALDRVEGRHARQRGREGRVQPRDRAQVDYKECLLQRLRARRRAASAAPSIG
jgi:hypothetical protein